MELFESRPPQNTANTATASNPVEIDKSQRTLGGSGVALHKLSILHILHKLNTQFHALSQWRMTPNLRVLQPRGSDGAHARLRCFLAELAERGEAAKMHS